MQEMCIGWSWEHPGDVQGAALEGRTVSHVECCKGPGSRIRYLGALGGKSGATDALGHASDSQRFIKDYVPELV